MSLLKTLAKVALGVAVAKGASSMMNRGGSSTQSSGGGLMDQLSQMSQGGQSGGGLQDMLGSVLGGAQQQQTGENSGGLGGLGGLLDSLSGVGTPRGGVETSQKGGGLDGLLDGLMDDQTLGGSGGLGGLLGSLTQGGSAGGLGGIMGALSQGGSGGDLGGLLGGLLGGGAAATAAHATSTTSIRGSNQDANNGKSFGEKLNRSLAYGDELEEAPTPQQEFAAGLMLRAMIQAAKSDGKIDDHEREKLLGQLGDISQQEREFVAAEMAAPVDVRNLAGQVPQGMEPQIYAMSVMAIDLDNRAEAQYLHDLATEMGIDKRGVNHIHAQLGVPSIYG